MPREAIFDFWTRQGRFNPWPTVSDYVFLGEVVLEFGRLLFGKAWRDIDPAVPPKPFDESLARASMAGLTDDDKEWRLRDKWLEKQSQLSSDTVPREMIPDLSYEGRARSYARAISVQREIVAFAQSGVLETFARPIVGGPLVPLRRSDWNTEKFAQRFDLCLINPRKPFSTEKVDREYIFVSQQSFDRALAKLKSRRRVNSLVNAETACRKWLEGEMRRSPLQRTRSRESFLEEALGKFTGLTKRGFDRAWDQAINITKASAWRLPGRPKNPRKNPRI
jgi:hypothetical protein